MSDEDQKLRVRLVGRNGLRRFETRSKERLVAACLEPGVSVSRLALDHGVNANLLRKWIKKYTAVRSLPPSSPSAFITVQLEETAERALSRQSSMATVDLPATCDEAGGSELKEAPALSCLTKVSASLSNGVKLALECGDVDVLTAIIGAWAMFGLGVNRRPKLAVTHMWNGPVDKVLFCIIYRWVVQSYVRPFNAAL